eukprot:TRINITY_DN3755_c0_g1_i3.p1 TRINITY_DN3755_c0_g1~~TRINITY_DN3755_c0_g1_i3.p1  ORF type:complete len:118 (-),score=25.84 TRINITY_DN3755_c0_g1_i3:81-434(-)
MIRRPPRSTLSSSSAASDVYKRQVHLPRAARLLERCHHEFHHGVFPQRTVLVLIALRHIAFACVLHAVRDRASPYSALIPVSYTHLRAHETPEHLVCRLLLEKKKKKTKTIFRNHNI